MNDTEYQDDYISSITNSSEDPIYCEPLQLLPLNITAGLVAAGIIVGNALVIQAITCGSARFFRPMYWFIIHLSVSDFCVGGMLLWNYCLAALFGINNTMASLTIMQGVWVTSATSSVAGILLLAVDRYMQVVHRRQHRMYFNQCTVAIAITIAWAVPIAIFLFAPLVSDWSCAKSCECQTNQYMHCEPISECSQVIPPFTKSYILVVIIFVFVMMPFPILIYGLIFLRARKSHQQATGQRMRHRDIRLIRTLSVIMLIFVCSLLPCGIVMCMDYQIDYPNPKLTDYALYVFVIGSLNSLANPFLYIWRIPAIRASLQRRWRFCSSKGTALHIASKARIHKVTDINSDMASVDGHEPMLNKKFPFCGKSAFTSNLSDNSNNSTPMSQRSNDELKSSKKPRKRFKFLQQQEMKNISPRFIQPESTSPLYRNSGLQPVRRDGNKQIVRPNRLSMASSAEDKHDSGADVILHRHDNDVNNTNSK